MDFISLRPVNIVQCWSNLYNSLNTTIVLKFKLHISIASPWFVSYGDVKSRNAVTAPFPEPSNLIWYLIDINGNDGNIHGVPPQCISLRLRHFFLYRFVAPSLTHHMLNLSNFNNPLSLHFQVLFSSLSCYLNNQNEYITDVPFRKCSKLY